MKVGDLVRHRIGSLDRIGMVIQVSPCPAYPRATSRDPVVYFFKGGETQMASIRYMEVINENR